MTNTGALKVTTPTDREIVMTRIFNAPRRLVWDAFTKPDLLKHWLFGPDDWTLAVCEIDLRAGGAYRYLWRRKSSGKEMGMGGVYREVAPPHIVATEKFDDAWYPGEGISTVEMTERERKTTVTNTMLYESRKARDAVLKSGMESGMALGYDRLDKVLASMDG